MLLELLAAAVRRIVTQPVMGSKAGPGRPRCTGHWSGWQTDFIQHLGWPGVHESDLGREPFEVLHPGAGLHGGPDHLGTGLRRMGAKAAMIWRRWAR